MDLELADGRVVARSAAFVRPGMVPHADGLLSGLGCAVDEAGFAVVDSTGRTSTPGVWAAGNVADPRAQVITAAGTGYREDVQLRVLIANERDDRLESLAAVVAALGHDVIAREVDVAGVARATALEQPDVAVVSRGRSSRHALALIEEIVGAATCPVIALTHAPDREFVHEASRLGVFAVVADHPVEDLESSIEIGLRRFGDYHKMEAALRRRALTERAKGILMERHSIDEAAAFQMLRHHSRTTNRKLVDTALAVLDGHRLLPGHAPAAQH